MSIMKSLPIFIMWIFVSLTIPSSKGAKDYNLRGSIGNANNIVDAILFRVRMEPVAIPDMSSSSLQITDVKVTGLASLYRKSDCTLDFDGITEKVTAELAMKNVKIHMKYGTKAGLIWIHGVATCTISEIAVKMEFVAENGSVKLNSFKVSNIGKVEITDINELTGLYNWMLKKVANNLANNARSKMITTLESSVANQIRKELKIVKVNDLSVEPLESEKHSTALEAKEDFDAVEAVEKHYIIDEVDPHAVEAIETFPDTLERDEADSDTVQIYEVFPDECAALKNYFSATETNDADSDTVQTYDAFPDEIEDLKRYSSSTVTDEDDSYTVEADTRHSDGEEQTDQNLPDAE